MAENFFQMLPGEIESTNYRLPSFPDASNQSISTSNLFPLLCNNNEEELLQNSSLLQNNIEGLIVPQPPRRPFDEVLGSRSPRISTRVDSSSEKIANRKVQLTDVDSSRNSHSRRQNNLYLGSKIVQDLNISNRDQGLAFDLMSYFGAENACDPIQMPMHSLNCTGSSKRSTSTGHPTSVCELDGNFLDYCPNSLSVEGKIAEYDGCEALAQSSVLLERSILLPSDPSSFDSPYDSHDCLFKSYLEIKGNSNFTRADATFFHTTPGYPLAQESFRSAQQKHRLDGVKVGGLQMIHNQGYGPVMSPRVDVHSSTPLETYIIRKHSSHDHCDSTGNMKRRQRQRKLSSPPFIVSCVDNVHSCQCGKRFKRYEHLRRHHRIHTQEKPFPCTVPGCKKWFGRTDNLAQHLRTHLKSPKSASERLQHITGVCDTAKPSYIRRSTMDTSSL